ncbi:MAG: alanine racemase [Anaerovoracaceae bacterium]|nr:alanine racemase [Anaerovoracaceae bacterium]
MEKKLLRPAWVEVNLSNLDYNLESIKKQIGPDVKIVGVVKADAYGSGAVRVAKELHEHGVDMFAVATLEEAIELREQGPEGVEIIILGLTPPSCAEEVVQYDIIAATDSMELAEALSEAGKAQGRTAKAIIGFDTGMGRIGFRPDDDYVGEIRKMQALPDLDIVGMFSHLSTADSRDKTYSHEQMAKYAKFVEDLKEAGIDLKIKTLANSASVVDLPDTYYTHVRPGIILYGEYSDEEVHRDEVPLKRVMQVKAQIMKVKWIDKGDSVGYGRKYRAPGRAKIATCNVGYADGYPRDYSPNAKVIVHGQFAPVAGNICMDQFMIDVTDVPDVEVGDEVILMGSDGNLSITAEEIAGYTGTIHNEILCAFGQRLPKVYVR